MGDNVFFICMMAAIVAVLFLTIRGLSSNAGRAREEAQVRQPGQVALELGLEMADQEPLAWQACFKEARLEYVAAEEAWAIQYRRVSNSQKSKMLQRRLALQADIAEYIDPVDCLRRLAKIAQAGLRDTQSPPVDPPSLSAEHGEPDQTLSRPRHR